MRFRTTLAIFALVLIARPVSTQRAPSSGPPFTPQESLATFHVADGFRVELFASEPLVASPVAMEIDEQGAMFVVEMPGYPLDTSGSGRIVRLRDTNGDGLPDRRDVFAEGLRLPTGIMKWKKGVLVTDSPQVWYLEDSDGDGRADIKREVLTGFALSNPQHTTNSPVYGLDNWIYLANEGPVRTVRYRDLFGDAGGDVRFPDRPDGPRLPPDADGRNVRFKPDTYELETLSGRSQFGQTFDAWGHHFDVGNSRPMSHEVLQAKYVTRNPLLAVPSAIEQVPEYRQPAEVFPITRDPEYQLLTDVGTMTSASGLTWYLADLFPSAYHNVAFVAEGAHNLVHALSIRDEGVSFRGSRLFEGREFLASTDAWFRPVNCYIGPDGALYVIDYYRKIIEHPEWLDDATAKSADLTAGRDRGRIYRIVPTAARTFSVAPAAAAAARPATRQTNSSRRRPAGRSNTPPPAAVLPRSTLASNAATPWLDHLSLADATDEELVHLLGHPNIWWRRHAQRLLVGRQPADMALPLAQAATSGPAVGRVHALWTLHGMRRLTTTVIERALLDPTPGVRENAIQLAELDVRRVPTLAGSLLRLVSDPDPKVRFQLLLTLGAIGTTEAASARQRMLLDNVENDWMQLAALSAAKVDVWTVFRDARARGGSETPGSLKLFQRIGAMAAATPDVSRLRELMQVVARDGASQDDWWRAATIDGVASGLKDDRRQSADLEPERTSMLNLLRRRQSSPIRHATLHFLEVAGLAKAGVDAAVADAAVTAGNPSLDPDARADAIRLLSMIDAAQYAPIFNDILRRAEPAQVHLAALRAIAEPRGEAAASQIVDLWAHWTPAVRDEAVRLSLRDPERVRILLDAIDAGTIKVSEIGWPMRVRMMMSDDDGLRARARQHFGMVGRESTATVTRYREALSLHGDVERGRQVFARVCSTCHQYRGEGGTAFGPDLAEARSHLPGSLVADILSPNQSIADGYELWVVQLSDGSTLSGMLASETPSAVTFRRMGGATEVVSRPKIASMKVAELSGMPEGLDAQIDVAQMADLIAFIRGGR